MINMNGIVLSIYNVVGKLLKNTFSLLIIKSTCLKVKESEDECFRIDSGMR